MLTPNYNSTPINVVIADDHSIFRKGLVATLRRHAEIIVIDQASNGKELLDKVEKKKTDVVLTDIQMPYMNGIEATAIISKKFPETSTIALSMYDQDNLIKEMFKAGAKGYLLKNTDENDIIKAIKTVYQKEFYYSSFTLSKLIRTDYSPFKVKNDPVFTEKELTVIKLICQQFSSKEIAARLNSTVRSIESAKERIQNKIEAKNMVGIALYAIKNNLLSLDEI